MVEEVLWSERSRVLFCRFFVVGGMRCIRCVVWIFGDNPEILPEMPAKKRHEAVKGSLYDIAQPFGQKRYTVEWLRFSCYA